MSVVTFVAKVALPAGYMYGQTYSLAFRRKEYDPRIDVIGEDSISLSGNRETIVHRRVRLWEITTGFLSSAEAAAFGCFLASVADGSTFQFDRDATDINTPVRPVDCELMDDDVKWKRISRSASFAFSFKIREIEQGADLFLSEDYYHDFDLGLLVGANLSNTPQVLPGFTYSRVDTGVTFALRENGLYEPVASNELASHYDRVNGREMGPWFGGALTNRLLQSCNLTNASWAVSNGTRAAATNKLFNHASATATKLTNTAGSCSLNQVVGTTNASPDTLSAVVETSGSNTKAMLRYTQNSVLLTQYVFDLTTGVPTQNGGTAGRAGAILLDNAGPNGGKVWYLWMQTATPTSGQTRQVSIYGDYLLTTGDLIVHGAQLVNNQNYVQPIVLTTTTSAGRGADVLQHSGFPYWLQDDFYSIGAVFDIWQASDISSNRYVAGLSAADQSNSAYIGMQNVATVYSRTYSANTSVAAPGATISAGRQRVVGRHRLNDFRACVNGVHSFDTNGVMPLAPDRLYIGCIAAGTGQPYGFISRVMFNPAALTDAELTAW